VAVLIAIATRWQRISTDHEKPETRRDKAVAPRADNTRGMTRACLETFGHIAPPSKLSDTIFRSQAAIGV
jgi:hypothetical protein